MGRLRKVVIFVVVFIIGGSVFFLVTQHDRQQGENLSTFTVQDLSAEEYRKISVEFTEIVDKNDPRVALSALRERIKSDPSVLRACHGISHIIGHAAYAKYKSFSKAMQFQDEICTGYIHGVIESLFIETSDLVQNIEIVCSPYSLGSYMARGCYHGVGHGLMYYTDQDLPRSLNFCDYYKNDFARRNCINGVFMANFNTFQSDSVSKYLKDDDLFYPCKDQEPRHKRDCYLYAPMRYLSFAPNDYRGALKWCNGAESSYISVCAEGVGTQAIKENILKPLPVEKMCAEGTPYQIEPCITGMIMTYVIYHGSITEAETLCPLLKETHRSTCREAIRQTASLFAK